MVREADARQQLGDAALDLTSRDAGHLEREGDIGRHRLRGQQVEVLEDHADPAAQGAQGAGVERADILTVCDDAAGAGKLQPVDQADEGRLAGA